MTPHTVTPDAISAAAARLRKHLAPTALRSSPHYGEAVGGTVLLKCDHQQPTGSFKVRGALNAVSMLDGETRARGVVTASSGNHGAAISWAMSLLGGKALVYTSANTPAVKIANIRRYGGEVVLCAGEYLEIETEARRAAAARGLTYVAPYNDPNVVAGQGTLGLEVADACARVDAVFVTVGGGGLIGGTAIWLKHRFPDVRIFGCLPANSAHMKAAVEGGDLGAVKELPTLSDGSAGSIEPDSITIDICRRLVDEFVEVPEPEIAREMREFVDGEHELIEGSAAVALAGMRKVAAKLRGRTAVAVLCGANVSSADLRRALELGAASEAARAP